MVNNNTKVVVVGPEMVFNQSYIGGFIRVMSEKADFECWRRSVGISNRVMPISGVECEIKLRVSSFLMTSGGIY